MIQSGEKPEEYREITDYWSVRLIENWNIFNPSAKKILLDIMKNTEILPEEFETCLELKPKDFDQVFFKNGMKRKGKAAPCFNKEYKSLEVGKGREEWGTKSGVNYFVIKLGKIL
jgi:hypothetical protein